MVTAEDAIRIYERLTGHHLPVWVIGGWGIDALLQEQTRPHKDLDVLVLVDDVARMGELLSGDGYEQSYLWPENRPTVDGRGVETATAFVLQDRAGHEIDVHALRLDEEGNGRPAWEAEEFIFPRQGLAGVGVIGGVTVHCIDPQMQVVCHTGYDLPDAHVRDMERLRERFGVEVVS